MEKRGLCFMDLLAVLFIAFKLLAIINWSWVWVVSPIWIAAILRAVIDEANK